MGLTKYCFLVSYKQKKNITAVNVGKWAAFDLGGPSIVHKPLLEVAAENNGQTAENNTQTAGP